MLNFKSFIVLGITISLFFCIVRSNAQTPDYLNPDLPVDVRLEDLLSRMTLEEKIGQMTQADHAAVSNFEDVKTKEPLKIPHMGWNTVKIMQEDLKTSMFKNIEDHKLKLIWIK